MRKVLVQRREILGFPRSMMDGDTYLLAHIQNGTGGAAGQPPGADVLTERDKQAVDLHPVALGKLCLQCPSSLFRRPCPDISPTVGHAVDMDIDTDTRLTAGDGQHQIGALGTDAGEGEEGVIVTRYNTTELITHAPSDVKDLTGFRFME